MTELASNIANILKDKGWQIKETFIEDLADTNTSPYWDKPENKFPREPQAHGYNAAKGFNLMAEKSEKKPVFTQDEVTEVKKLIVLFSDIVFGHQLPNSTSR